MVECPNCGQEVRGAFCTNCGTRVEQPAPGAGARSGASATSAIRASDLQELAERERAASAGGSVPADTAPSADTGDSAADQTVVGGFQGSPLPGSGPAPSYDTSPQDSTQGTYAGASQGTYGDTAGSGYTGTAGSDYGAGTQGSYSSGPQSYGGGYQSGFGSQGSFGGGTAMGGRMSLSQLIDGAVQLYQANYQLFLGVLAVVFVPQAIISIILPLLGGLWSILDVVGIGALIVAIAARYQGRPMSIEEAYGALGVGGAVTLLVAYLIAGIITAISVIGLIILAIYVGVRFAFIGQAVVLERADIMTSLSRSWNLVAGQWWRTFITALVVFIGAAIISGIIGGIIGQILGVRIGSAVGPLLDIVLYPVTFGVMTLLYFDIRREKEGFVPESADFGVAQPV